MAVLKMNFLSQCLGMQTNVTICLPSYSFADRMSGREEVYVPGMKYQVLWLLHGGSGDDSDFLHFSNITRYADDHKLAVVMPADYNAMYDDREGGAQYRTYIAEELPKLCRALFPFSEKREDNFIAGLSMGSGGCQKIAIRYPENFAAALCMSGAAFDYTVSSRMPVSDAVKAGIDENIAIARKNRELGLKVPKFFMTWGGDDFVREGHLGSSKLLTGLGYEVYDEEVPGYGHEWDFWDLSLRKAIESWLPIRHSAIYPGEE